MLPTVMAGRVDVVVGGGQAGLATSYYLTRAGIDHVVLERDRIGERWRSERWDSFTLVTPNWATRLPGFPYEGDDPDGFSTREEVIEYLEAYVDHFDPPVRCGVEVTAVRSSGTGFTVATTGGTYETSNVVVATGTFQRPRIPAFAVELPSSVRQLHASRYENPDRLPAGGVLVVGSAQSGAQIARELHESGREVYLSVSSAPKAPRRYRGRDIVGWMVDVGSFETTVDELPSPADRFAPSAYGSGRNGGEEIDLLDLAAAGTTLLGRTEGVRARRLVFADDLEENLRHAYRFYTGLLERVDRHIETAGVDAPAPDLDLVDPDGISVDPPRNLDLEDANVRTVVWATGYDFDFEWVEPATVDEYGYPIHERGITGTPGLYFVGLLWLHTQGSSLLYGVGDDAEHVVADVVDRTTRLAPSS